MLRESSPICPYPAIGENAGERCPISRSPAAEIANKVFYCNAAPMLAAYLLCDVLLTVGMLVLIWKGLLPLKNTAQRILASLCSPIAFAGIVGNLLTLQPWPLNQLDHGTESAGHLLVLTLGLVLLRKMTENGELKEAKS